MTTKNRGFVNKKTEAKKV